MSKYKEILLITLFIVVFISSCGPVTPYAVPTFSIPTKLPLLPTATLVPAEAFVGLSKPKNIYDPKDPSLPELIIPNNEGSGLDLNWQIAKIEYVYDWWGMGEPGLGYEKIERKNAEYYWNDQKIDIEKVQEFIKALSDLHPAQSLLVGTWHTDDYPTWQVELTGIDGNHVLIYSSSNENPGYGPWHVIYNGRIYAQYDGAIGLAIGKLFGLKEDSFVWKADYPEYHPDGLVGFATEGWPNQLWYGFEGLLPVSGSFHYYVDPEKKEIQGYVRGRYSIGGFGNMVVGKIESLHSVKLNIDNKQIFCEIKKVENEDVYSEEWAFLCKIPEVKIGQRYSYPVEVVFDTDNKQRFVVEGKLYGMFGSQSNFWTIPPAEEIQMAIAENPNMQALLDNAVIYVSEYEGKLQMKKDKSPVLAGQFTLVGDMEIDGTKIKYSVFTPFIVENHRFTKFGLTEQELKRFLYDVVQSPVTRRMLIYYPDMTLNLWYVAESDESEPEMPQLLLIFEKSKSINPANQF